MKKTTIIELHAFIDSVIEKKGLVTGRMLERILNCGYARVEELLHDYWQAQLAPSLRKVHADIVLIGQLPGGVNHFMIPQIPGRPAFSTGGLPIRKTWLVSEHDVEEKKGSLGTFLRSYVYSVAHPSLSNTERLNLAAFCETLEIPTVTSLEDVPIATVEAYTAALGDMPDSIPTLLSNRGFAIQTTPIPTTESKDADDAGSTSTTIGA